jgi:GT2 family glycosyltransferase
MDDRKKPDKKISVIISSFSGNESLTQKCIDSLERQGMKPDEIIIVVDTEKERVDFEQGVRAQDLNVRVVASGKQGLVAARNKGIDVSIGDIVAFIDDDAEPEKDWVSRILKSFASHDAAVMVGGRAIPRFQGRPLPQSFYWLVGCTSEDPPTRRPIGCNMAFRRKLFEKTGKFDENLVKTRRGMGVSEETELILRIRDTLPGSAIVFDPDIIVYHFVPERRTRLKYIVKRAFAEGGAKAYTTKKYGKDIESSYLRYYLLHPDFLTIMVLCATGLGYLKGRLQLS